MDMIPTRPTPELNHLIASALQGTRFKERRQREAGSDLQNQVVFFSPVVRIDAETQSVVIQYRDTETGEITNEFPNPNRTTAYQHASETTPKEMSPMIPVDIKETSVTEEPAGTPSLDEHA